MMAVTNIHVTGLIKHQVFISTGVSKFFYNRGYFLNFRRYLKH